MEAASGSESTFDVENVEILRKAEHLSLHIYGRVNNFEDQFTRTAPVVATTGISLHLVQELHLWPSRRNLLAQFRNVHHSEDLELNQGKDSKPLDCGNQSLLSTGTSTPPEQSTAQFALCVSPNASAAQSEMSSTLSMNCPCTPWTAGT